MTDRGVTRSAIPLSHRCSARDSGTCCDGTDGTCPGGGGTVYMCDSPSMCQGTADTLACTGYRCVGESGVPDDSGCDTGTLAKDCGLYDPVYCDGTVDQTEPSCATSCTDDAGCVDGAHCESTICAPDRGVGGSCSRDGECEAALYCVDNHCCDMPCDGACETCDQAGSEGTCVTVSGCTP